MHPCLSLSLSHTHTHTHTHACKHTYLWAKIQPVSKPLSYHSHASELPNGPQPHAAILSHVDPSQKQLPPAGPPQFWKHQQSQWPCPGVKLEGRQGRCVPSQPAWPLFLQQTDRFELSDIGHNNSLSLEVQANSKHHMDTTTCPEGTCFVNCHQGISNSILHGQGGG